MHIEAIDLRIDGAGSTDTEFGKLAETLPLHKGDVLEHAHYEETKRALLDLATERGSLDARWLHSELRVDLAHNTAVALLHMDTGPRYRFGNVRFLQDFFDPDFLARYLSFKPGEPYSNTALIQLQTALSQTDYFQ